MEKIDLVAEEKKDEDEKSTSKFLHPPDGIRR